jgi:hypothetical protein
MPENEPKQINLLSMEFLKTLPKITPEVADKIIRDAYEDMRNEPRRRDPEAPRLSPYAASKIRPRR